MKARLLVIAAAVLFSTGGAAIKGTSLNAWQVAGLRSLVAAIAMVILIPETRGRWRWRYVPLAMAYAATLVLFVTATKLTTAANAIFLQDTAPLFVLLLSPLLLQEHIRRADLLLMVAVAFGLVLFFTAGEASRSTAPDPPRGNLLALASAVTYALTLTGLRKMSRTGDTVAGMTTVTMGNLMASAATLPLGFPIHLFDVRDIAVILWLGVFQVGLAYVLLTRGVQSVRAFEATTLLLLEPALNPVWTWLVHGEAPARQSLAGGLIIVLATLANAWWHRRDAAS